jgi:hypothetical protein
MILLAGTEENRLSAKVGFCTNSGIGGTSSNEKGPGVIT